MDKHSYIGLIYIYIYIYFIYLFFYLFIYLFFFFWLLGCLVVFGDVSSVFFLGGFLGGGGNFFDVWI